MYVTPSTYVALHLPFTVALVSFSDVPTATVSTLIHFLSGRRPPCRLFSMPRHYLAWEKATSAHSIPFPRSEFYATAGMPAAAILRSLIATHLPDTPPADVPALIDTIVAAKATALGAIPPPAPIPAVLAVVTAARSAGLAVSVASGGARADVEAALESAGIADWFAATVCAEDVTHGKPAPDVFLAAAAQMGCPPGARVMGLEDADMGLQALLAAGMTGVDVRCMQGYPLPPKQ